MDDGETAAAARERAAATRLGTTVDRVRGVDADAEGDVHTLEEEVG